MPKMGLAAYENALKASAPTLMHAWHVRQMLHLTEGLAEDGGLQSTTFTLFIKAVCSAKGRQHLCPVWEATRVHSFRSDHDYRVLS